jgi:hypothetical protein
MNKDQALHSEITSVLIEYLKCLTEQFCVSKQPQVGLSTGMHARFQILIFCRLFAAASADPNFGRGRGGLQDVI